MKTMEQTTQIGMAVHEIVIKFCFTFIPSLAASCLFYAAAEKLNWAKPIVLLFWKNLRKKVPLLYINFA